jgi:phosphoribosylanthranilate isomerase
MKKTVIKICGNTTFSNAEKVMELVPEMMGFIFYKPSKRFVHVEDAKKITRALKGIKMVGVFVNEEMEKISEMVTELNLNGIQLHGNESPDFCKKLKETAFIIKALDGNAADLQKQIDLYENSVDYYLLDNMGENYGGSGKHFEIANIQYLRFNHPFLVAGGIGPDDTLLVSRLKLNNMFLGVDLNSKFEISPGIKNITSLQTFLNLIK